MLSRWSGDEKKKSWCENWIWDYFGCTISASNLRVIDKIRNHFSWRRINTHSIMPAVSTKRELLADCNCQIIWNGSVVSNEDVDTTTQFQSRFFFLLRRNSSNNHQKEQYEKNAPTCNCGSWPCSMP